jgi:hypothetical protein
MHMMEKLWRAAYVFHAEGSLEADLWVLERTLRILNGGRKREQNSRCGPYNGN